MIISLTISLGSLEMVALLAECGNWKFESFFFSQSYGNSLINISGPFSSNCCQITYQESFVNKGMFSHAPILNMVTDSTRELSFDDSQYHLHRSWLLELFVVKVADVLLSTMVRVEWFIPINGDN